MNRFLKNAPERIAMGRQGALKAKELFDVRTMVAAYERLYESL
jgi:glycosyltransferase involved in cell wall biosynthesis